MAKRKAKLTIRIPPYKSPRNSWRQKIHRTATLEAQRVGVSYQAKNKLQLKIRLYFKNGALLSHDLDNRLKDIMDALQGRAGGSKKVRTLPAIVPNDSQIYRVVIEKGLPSKQSKGFGHLIITKYGGKKA